VNTYERMVHGRSKNHIPAAKAYQTSLQPSTHPRESRAPGAPLHRPQRGRPGRLPQRPALGPRCARLLELQHHEALHQALVAPGRERK
jgi:hypothetical protein